ncbi:MAG: hypothetical protein Q7S74_05845 [Nanoarchaeota archaeon]|nr:hypothetical protein [Nanoarchaeota archaeon]
MPNQDNNWFDAKYKDKIEVPTLEDKMKLISTSGVNVPERFVVNMEQKLKDSLHELSREYTPAQHVLAYQFLSFFHSFEGADLQKKTQYLQAYRATMKKHADKVVLKTNFK